MDERNMAIMATGGGMSAEYQPMSTVHRQGEERDASILAIPASPEWNLEAMIHLFG